MGRRGVKMMWMIESLAAMLVFAFMCLTINYLTSRGTSVYFSMLVIAIVWLPYFFVRCVQTEVDFSAISWETWAILLVVGMLSALGNGWQFDASDILTRRQENAGVVFAIVGCQAALYALLAWYFLDVAMSTLKILGIIGCAISVAVICLG